MSVIPSRRLADQRDLSVEELAEYVTRLTFDANTVPREDRAYDPRLRFDVNRLHRNTSDKQEWLITQFGGSSALNLRTGSWDTDREFRHADEPSDYLTSLDLAVRRAHRFIDDARRRSS